MQSGDLEDTVVLRPRTADQASKVYVLFNVSPASATDGQSRVLLDMDSLHRTEKAARQRAREIMKTSADWGIWLKYEHVAAFPGMNDDNNYTIVGNRSLLGNITRSDEGRGFVIEIHNL